MGKTIIYLGSYIHTTPDKIILSANVSYKHKYSTKCCSILSPNYYYSSVLFYIIIMFWPSYLTISGNYRKVC
jgi:hypothetical protein